MSQGLGIRRIAVLGAGVMGAQIGALLSLRFNVLLFDRVSDEPEANALVNQALQGLTKLKPPPLAVHGMEKQIVACNYRDDLARLSDCDLVIEAVAEDLTIKQALYDQILPHLQASAILVSNTSGLSINALCDVLPANRQSRFCGVHFFNPPRYMPLLELIPATHTDPDLLDKLETFFVQHVGKGVIRAKDTPNFIANRVGVFSLLSTMHHAQAFDLSPPLVDALTGMLVGRPKSATYRTIDVVGLDTMARVVATMDDHLQDDPWHQQFKLAQWLKDLIADGALGQKTRRGIYCKVGKAIHTWSPSTQRYTAIEARVSPTVKAMFTGNDPQQWLPALAQSDDLQAQFLWACFRDLFAYCAYHLQGIADTTRDIDLALRWGFGWQQGPFELWQRAGIANIAELMGDKLAVTLPSWVNQCEAFYRAEGSLAPTTGDYQPRSRLPVYAAHLTADPVLAEPPLSQTVLLDTDAVCLWQSAISSHVAILSIKTANHCITEAVLSGLTKALSMVEASFAALVLCQPQQPLFSAGAAYAELLNDDGILDRLTVSAWVDRHQQATQAIKYAAVPVVAAVNGQALGVGCEWLMHCDAAVVGLETYLGLETIRLGLPPMAGGLTQLAQCACDEVGGLPSYDRLECYFKQIATAEVSSSALAAKHMAYLPQQSTIVSHQHAVLRQAIVQAQFLADSDYLPPPRRMIAVAGRQAWARLMMLVANWQAGEFASAHDCRLAEKVAEVLTGGDLDPGQMVDEAWLLRLQREAFVDLAMAEENQQRLHTSLANSR